MSAELRDAQEGPFEDWWVREGQYLRAGGDSYSKTFAWHAWCEATSRAQAPAAEPQWQPIETAPKDGTAILLYTAQGAIEGWWYHNGWEQSVCAASYDMAAAYIECKPTHWMPQHADPTA